MKQQITGRNHNLLSGVKSHDTLNNVSKKNLVFFKRRKVVQANRPLVSDSGSLERPEQTKFINRLSPEMKVGQLKQGLGTQSTSQETLMSRLTYQKKTGRNLIPLNFVSLQRFD